MTRGNQRDKARAKNEKAKSDASKGKRDDGLTVAQRKQRDADAVRAKQEASDKAKAEAAGQAIRK